MSTAQKNALAVTDQPAASQIQGRLDAIEGRRLFGWVWDSTRPTERLLIRILLEGRMICSATADLPRVDLRRNGIGDGGHAFEVTSVNFTFAFVSAAFTGSSARAVSVHMFTPAAKQPGEAGRFGVFAPNSSIWMEQYSVARTADMRAPLSRRVFTSMRIVMPSVCW